MQHTRPQLGFGVAIALAAGVVLAAQGAPAQPPATATQQQPTFRRSVEAVSMDAIVRNEREQFVADLTKDEFEIYEDGVKQTIQSMTLVQGGRVHNLLAPPPPPTQEGIVLLPDHRRRPAPRFPEYRTHSRPVQAHFAQSRARRRHVRHGLDRALVHRGRSDLRP
jgi:hypothetical protein